MGSLLNGISAIALAIAEISLQPKYSTCVGSWGSGGVPPVWECGKLGSDNDGIKIRLG